MPPEAPDEQAGTTPPAVSLRLETLAKRADFLACARGRKVATPGFLLQARRSETDSQAIRVGYTASKKVGNAVTRNRAKRRLRGLAREVLAREGQPGWDYVLVARAGTTVSLPFALLKADLHRAVGRLHQPDKAAGARAS